MKVIPFFNPCYHIHMCCFKMDPKYLNSAFSWKCLCLCHTLTMCPFPLRPAVELFPSFFLMPSPWTVGHKHVWSCGFYHCHTQTGCWLTAACLSELADEHINSITYNLWQQQILDSSIIRLKNISISQHQMARSPLSARSGHPRACFAWEAIKEFQKHTQILDKLRLVTHINQFFIFKMALMKGMRVAQTAKFTRAFLIIWPTRVFMLWGCLSPLSHGSSLLPWPSV